MLYFKKNRGDDSDEKIVCFIEFFTVHLNGLRA